MAKCRICREPTTNRYGLVYACTVEHAIAFAAKAKAKKALQDRKHERKITREAKAKNKTLKTLCAEARVVIQKFARLRDRKWGICICCGSPKIEHGAHYFAVGSQYQCARLALNPRQVNGSCLACNVFVGGGNRQGYDIGLEVRYGKGILEELQELKRRADGGEDAPLTKEEVRLIKSEYAAKCRELLKQQEKEYGIGN